MTVEPSAEMEELLRACRAKELSEYQWAMVVGLVAANIPVPLTPERKLRAWKDAYIWDAAIKAGFKGGHSISDPSPFRDGYLPPKEEFARIESMTLEDFEKGRQ